MKNIILSFLLISSLAACTGKTTIIIVDEDSEVNINGMAVETNTDQTADGEADIPLI